MAVKHPATFSGVVLDEMELQLSIHELTGGRILDPFAGTGGIHRLHDSPLAYDTVGVELEREWAEQHERTDVGDATALDFPDRSFDVIATSPCYGNRFADKCVDARGHTRRNYRQFIGRELSQNSSAVMQWGDEYRNFHVAAWTETTRVAKPGALFLLNIKDHVRNKKVQPVSAWHLWALAALDWAWIGASKVLASGFTRGENRERTGFEWVHQLRLGLPD